jgi:GT2 family glycosyltransferase
MNLPKISFCILTHNRSELLNKALYHLKRLQYHPLEIIVVDNHSVDQTNEMITRHHSDVYYIRMDKNIGASARNYGLKSATGDIVITLDDDIIGIDDTDLYELIKIFTINSSVGAINFKISDPEGKICNWVHHRTMETNFDKEFNTYEITEGAVAFRMQAIQSSGYYADCYFLSHEGPDLAFRLMDLGYDVIYTNKISVIHFHSELGRRNWYNYYYDTRNQIWLSVRNFPFPYSFYRIVRGLAPMLLYSIRDRFVGYWIKAVGDGMRGVAGVSKNKKILRRQTIKKIKKIDSQSPPILYLLKKRLLSKGVRL